MRHTVKFFFPLWFLHWPLRAGEGYSGRTPAYSVLKQLRANWLWAYRKHESSQGKGTR